MRRSVWCPICKITLTELAGNPATYSVKVVSANGSDGALGARYSRSIATRSGSAGARSEEHTSELQSPDHLVCRLLLEKKKQSIQQELPVARGRVSYTATK